MKKEGFNSELYLKKESLAIKDRINRFDKLYLEIGGKLFYDFHAERVLPGYNSTNKLKLLKKLGKIGIIYCINANDIEHKRIIHDFNLTAEEQAIKNLKQFNNLGLKVSYIAITLYEKQEAALDFKKRLEKMGFKVVIYKKIDGYPYKISRVIRGFEAQPYFPIKNRLTIVTGVASDSGKMGVALNQIYHEMEYGIKTGFAKLETFPIWNLPLNHPINLAYEAATADLRDKNMIDQKYRKIHGKDAVNYNRDIENFDVLQKLYYHLTNEKDPFGYSSPTEMGLNMAGFAIIDDSICRDAADKEIARRYKQYLGDYKKGRETISTVKRIKEILRVIKEEDN